MTTRSGWVVSFALALLFAACGGDDSAPPAGGGNKSGSGGNSGSAGTGTGGSGADASAGSGGSAGGSAGTDGSSGAAGSGGTAGTDPDAGDGSAGTDGGASNLVGVNGGTVSDPAGNITLVIPPGALLGDTQFTFTDVPSVSALPSDVVFVPGTGHRIDWTLAGFAPGAKVNARVRLPATQPLNEDELAQALPFCMWVVCPDGTIATDGCVLINGGTMAQDVAPVCLTSNMTIAVTNPMPYALPAITTQPGSLTVGAGDQAGFSVVATGSAPLSYQWRRNGTDIANATSANYALSVTYPSDTGAKFSVRVSNRLGSVISNEAVLTVGPPRTPTWATATPVNAFATGVDLPQTGSLAGLDFVAWNDNGTLRGKVAGAGAYAPIDTLAQPTRSRPKVVTGGNSGGGFIVFADDTGTSSCSPAGNRLSGVAVRIGPEGQLFPRSNRFTLYESASGCIAGFSAGLIDTDFATARPLAFALSEIGTGALKVGSGGAIWDEARSDWSYSTAALASLTLSPGCTGPAFLIDESLAGRRQGYVGGTVPNTSAVLAWIANENLCAATLDAGAWSQGSVVFDKAIGDPAIGPPEPVAAIDSDGKALVVASRVIDPAATPYRQEMTAAFRAAAGGAWDVKALDSSPAIALPSAAFTPASSNRPESAQFAGSALVVWRPSLPAAPTTVYAAVRSPNGTWQTTRPISSSSAADTRFPRVCVDNVGNAVAVYSEKATVSDPFQIWGRIWSGGEWSAPGRVQNSANEGRFADCVRHAGNAFLRDGVFVSWRETDPNDANRFRIVNAR